jgi:presenilin-like A22 family membrane protease
VGFKRFPIITSSQKRDMIDLTDVDRTDIKLGNLKPQLWVVFLAGILSYFLIQTDSTYERLTVFPETTVGASLNSFFFVITLFIIATIIYLIVKHGLLSILKYALRFSLILSTFLLTNWYISKIIQFSHTELFVDTFSFMVSICLIILVWFTVYRRKGTIQVLTIGAIGSLIGTFLAFTIPLLSATILLLALVIYDILSVYKGPIGKLSENIHLSEFTGAAFTFEDVTIGMGDVVFYSMLVSMALKNFGISIYVVSSIGVLLGAYLGMRMLEKRDFFPGLPLAILIGLIMMFSSVYLTNHITLP